MSNRSWSGFFINLLGVILGIMLTFGGNTLWKRFEEKKKTNDMLILIRKELETNKEWFIHQEKTMMTDGHVYEKILNAKSDWSTIPADSLSYYYSRARHFEFNELTTTAWQIFHTTDISERLSDKELVIRLTDCYYWIGKIEELLMKNYWNIKVRIVAPELDPVSFFDAMMNDKAAVFFYTMMSPDNFALKSLFPHIYAIIDYTIMLLDKHGNYVYDMDDKDKAFEAYIEARVDSVLTNRQ